MPVCSKNFYTIRCSPNRKRLPAFACNKTSAYPPHSTLSTDNNLFFGFVCTRAGSLFSRVALALDRLFAAQIGLHSRVDDLVAAAFRPRHASSPAFCHDDFLDWILFWTKRFFVDSKIGRYFLLGTATFTTRKSAAAYFRTSRAFSLCCICSLSRRPSARFLARSRRATARFFLRIFASTTALIGRALSATSRFL